MAAQITKDMIINDIISIEEAIVPILMASGMHCVGCPSARGETLEEACFVHGMDADQVINEINEYLAQKEEAK